MWRGFLQTYMQPLNLLSINAQYAKLINTVMNLMMFETKVVINFREPS